MFIYFIISRIKSFSRPFCVNKSTHTSRTPLSRSSTNPPSWLEEEEASIASSSYSKKQQPPFAQQQQPPHQQKLMQSTPQQQTLALTQPQHSPGSNELKLSSAQQSNDDKLLFDNDGGNMENETKSVSSMRSQDR